MVAKMPQMTKYQSERIEISFMGETAATWTFGADTIATASTVRRLFASLV
jgi:hypothetical protein